MDPRPYEGSYFVLEMSNDGNATAKAIYEWPNLDTAMEKYHTTLASFRANKSLKWAACEVIDEYMSTIVEERFERPEVA